MILETKRLLLRPWTLADAEDLFEYAQDPLVGPVAGWPLHKNIEESREVIEQVFNEPDSFAMVLKTENKVVGSIGLRRLPNTNLAGIGESDLGFCLAVPYWGQGLTPEAAKEVIRYGFEEAGDSAIWAANYEGNQQSARVQEKCGLSFVRKDIQALVPLLGEHRDRYIRRITKDEWLALKLQ